MSVRNSPRVRRTGSLVSIPEEDGSESSRSRPPVSLPTEYNQSYRSRNVPRPRNPRSGWQTRNNSTILPHDPNQEPPPERARPLRRRPENYPWLARQESQIFPAPVNNQVNVNRQAGGGNNQTTDENNNPDLGLPRRRPVWPWQERAQRSSIFYSEAITNPQPQPHPQRASSSQSGTSRWPWAERAKKSVIFDLITSEDPVKLPKHRKYEWDQRQSSSIKACVNKQEEESSTAAKKPKQWPWEERAKKSVIFTSPDKPRSNREMKYVWDQRKSRFSVKLDPEAKFSQGSHYSDNFGKYAPIPINDLQQPAGKPCYGEEDVDIDSQNKVKTGKRKVQSAALTKKKSNNVILSSVPSPPVLENYRAKETPRRVRSDSSIGGKICLELVPADFDFKAETEKLRQKTPSPKKPERNNSPLKNHADSESPKRKGKSGSPKKDENGNSAS